MQPNFKVTSDWQISAKFQDKVFAYKQNLKAKKNVSPEKMGIKIVIDNNLKFPPAKYKNCFLI